MLLEIDKRYDFDPSSLWTLKIKIERGRDNMFSSPVTRFLTTDIQYPKKYFDIPKLKVTPKAKEKSEVKQKFTSKAEQKIKTINKTKIKQEFKQVPLETQTKQNINEISTTEFNQEIKEEIILKIKQELKQ